MVKEYTLFAIIVIVFVALSLIASKFAPELLQTTILSEQITEILPIIEIR